MNTTIRSVSVALAAALASPSLFAASSVPIDFHGYLRSGVGVSRDGGMEEWQKIKLAVWVTRPIPTASWSWAQRCTKERCQLLPRQHGEHGL